MQKHNHNIILTIKLNNESVVLPGEQNTAPIQYTNIDTEIGENRGNFEYDHNSVPCDFDGKRVLWLDYVSKNLRHLKVFDCAANQMVDTVAFEKSFGLL